MELQKLAETVILELECFWILQELDEGVRRKDTDTVTLLSRMYSNRNVKWQYIHPFVRLNTVLALLVVPIAFVARLSDDELSSLGFSIKEDYDVLCREGKEPAHFSAREFLQVIRNAVAHLPDFASGRVVDVNISFNEGILRCWSQNHDREVVFQTEQGFVCFLNDFVHACKQAARRLIQDA